MVDYMDEHRVTIILRGWASWSRHSLLAYAQKLLHQIASWFSNKSMSNVLSLGHYFTSGEWIHLVNAPTIVITNTSLFKYTHGKKISITHSLTKMFYFDLINNPTKKQNRNIIESVYKWVYYELGSQCSFEITAFTGLRPIDLDAFFFWQKLHMITSMVL